MTQSGDQQHEPDEVLGTAAQPEEKATKHGIPNPATGAGIGATEPNSFEPEEAE